MSIAKLEPGWPFQENKLQYDIWDKSDKVQTEWIQIWHIASILMKKRQNKLGLSLAKLSNLFFKFGVGLVFAVKDWLSLRYVLSGNYCWSIIQTEFESSAFEISEFETSEFET